MANVGKGAASGAAIGSAISPGLGTAIGGIGGAASLRHVCATCSKGSSSNNC